MSTILVGQENSMPIELYYEDHGSGPPVVLIHGWPLSGASWEKQVAALLAAGCRVVTYDRRGFGRSSQPSTGYDYDTFSEDLHQVLTQLDLRDVALVGFSMGGGEVARYLGARGSDRVSRAVFISAIPPYLRKAADNPEGVDPAVFDGIQKAIAQDRPAFLREFFKNFYNVDALGGSRISDAVLDYSWNVAVEASAKGTYDCVAAWGTDFRKDLQKIDVPTLVIHGDQDRIVPIAASAIRTSKQVKGSRLATLPGAPHGCLATHGDEVNRELVSFVGQRSEVGAA
jgi:pimeloyl-ACP methyl ester carboxylesterase